MIYMDKPGFQRRRDYVSFAQAINEAMQARLMQDEFQPVEFRWQGRMVAFNPMEDARLLWDMLDAIIHTRKGQLLPVLPIANNELFDVWCRGDNPLERVDLHTFHSFGDMITWLMEFEIDPMPARTPVAITYGDRTQSEYIARNLPGELDCSRFWLSIAAAQAKGIA